MEYEGCKRTLNSIIKKKIPICCLTTDRHTIITAKMRSSYPKITHQYDVWHISKWITKKITKKAKKKGCKELLPWIRNVSNHLWCVQQPVTRVLTSQGKNGCHYYTISLVNIDGKLQKTSKMSKSVDILQ